MLKIRFPRSYAEEVEQKLNEIIDASDPSGSFKVDNEKRISGAEDILSIVASLSAIGANAFVVWVALEERRRRDIKVDDDSKSDSPKK